MSPKYLSLALAAMAVASPFEEFKRDGDESYKACKPKGATTDTPPSVGPGLTSLYTNVVASVQGISFKQRSVDERAEGFACHPSLDCVNVQNLNIPMCYDKFTTNFQFPDGSHGTIATGEYHSGGTDVNLVSGDYTKDGQTANIYSGNEAEKPNTSTMSIPPQFTGTGVGGAIPETELGSIVVYTTTLPPVTYTAPTTVPESVITATVSGQEVKSTIPATTITQATTVAGKTAVVTETKAAKPTGAAAHVDARSFEMSVFGALIYAFL
ncbi:hypothetical protein yc1106_07381 [Curvularia clavata]|uniref:Uncharacterized protein n=1 Tax=Curvularia clavata TaxID=95742 RepID=A0A9Q9DUS1_CURCL|nr:hypothetical protein yc1106_07381 [Curvularia clavata]